MKEIVCLFFLYMVETKQKLIIPFFFFKERKEGKEMVRLAQMSAAPLEDSHFIPKQHVKHSDALSAFFFF